MEHRDCCRSPLKKTSMQKGEAFLINIFYIWQAIKCSPKRRLGVYLRVGNLEKVYKWLLGVLQYLKYLQGSLKIVINKRTHGNLLISQDLPTQ